MLFDYWGNRTAGEDPNGWFRERYSQLGGFDPSNERFTDPSRRGDPNGNLPGNPLDDVPSGPPIDPILPVAP